MLAKVFQPFKGCGYEWPSLVGVPSSFKVNLNWFYGETLELHVFRKGFIEYCCQQNLSTGHSDPGGSDLRPYIELNK